MFTEYQFNPYAVLSNLVCYWLCRLVFLPPRPFSDSVCAYCPLAIRWAVPPRGGVSEGQRTEALLQSKVTVCCCMEVFLFQCVINNVCNEVFSKPSKTTGYFWQDDIICLLPNTVGKELFFAVLYDCWQCCFHACCVFLVYHKSFDDNHFERSGNPWCKVLFIRWKKTKS